MMPTDSDIRAIRRFNRWHRENPTARSSEDLEKRRLSAFGIAAVALAILVQLLQARPLDGSLTMAAAACAVAITCGTFDALVTQIYLGIGEQSFAHIHLRYFMSGSELLATRGAMASILIAVAGVLWHLSIVAFILFVLTAFGFLWNAFYWYIDLTRWWFDAGGPGEEQPADHDHREG